MNDAVKALASWPLCWGYRRPTPKVQIPPVSKTAKRKQKRGSVFSDFQSNRIQGRGGGPRWRSQGVPSRTVHAVSVLGCRKLIKKPWAQNSRVHIRNPNKGPRFLDQVPTLVGFSVHSFPSLGPGAVDERRVRSPTVWIVVHLFGASGLGFRAPPGLKLTRK